VYGGLKHKKSRHCILQSVATEETLARGFVLHISKSDKSDLKDYINQTHRGDKAYKRLARKWETYDVAKRAMKIQRLSAPAAVWRCCSSRGTCSCNQELFDHFFHRVCRRKTLASAVHQVFLKRGHALMFSRMNL
jgi:hypothetical protein